MPRSFNIIAKCFNYISVNITVVRSFEVEAQACFIPGTANILTIAVADTIQTQIGVSVTSKFVQ